VREYLFIAEYNGTESEEVEHKLLHTKALLKHILTCKDTGEIWANRKYTLMLPDGSEIGGTTDEDGYIEQAPSPIGEIVFLIHKEDTNGG
jgi:uncharacterized protein (DUF2345 family)